MTGLWILATLQAELGDLDRIERIVRVFGMVNCAPGFNRTPAVIDGCSDLLVELFGPASKLTVVGGGFRVYDRGPCDGRPVVIFRTTLPVGRKGERCVAHDGRW
jgi:hypothetical protein